MALFILLILLAADGQPVLVLLSSGHPSPDMTLRFIHIQHNPRLGSQGGIDMLQAVGYVFMYRRFTDPKFFRRLPYRRIVVYNVIGYGHRPLFDILLQGVPPEYVFYSICKGMREYVWTNLLAEYFFD